MPILQPESRAVGTLTLLRLECPGSGPGLAGSERGRDQRVILSSGGTTAMGAWEEEQRWGVGSLSLELLSQRSPGQASGGSQTLLSGGRESR